MITHTIGNRRDASIALNNLGVQLIETGKHKEATNKFMLALAILSGKSIARIRAQLNQGGGNQSTDPSSTKRRRLLSGIEPLVHHHAEENDKSIFVYCHAFRIMAASDKTPEESIALTYATIFFNLAIMMHLKYLASSDHPKQSLSLTNALSLYEKVNRIIELEETKALVNDPCFRLVMMGTCNNMTHIHFSLENFNSLTSSKAALIRLLLLTPYPSTGIPLLSKVDMDGFCLNIFLLRAPTLSAAA